MVYGIILSMLLSHIQQASAEIEIKGEVLSYSYVSLDETKGICWKTNETNGAAPLVEYDGELIAINEPNKAIDIANLKALALLAKINRSGLAKK
jgi:hypothetical protein